jgi:alpha,alpha-trehalase
MPKLRLLFWMVLALLMSFDSPILALPQKLAPTPALHPGPAVQDGLKPILNYISAGWTTLTRSMDDCSTIVDSKLATKSILYVPADFPISDKLRALEQRCNIDVKPLPKVIHKLGEIDPNTFSPHGLLYLEHPYVVPGGRFNEMYGWDSYEAEKAQGHEDRAWLERAYAYAVRDHALWINEPHLAGDTGLSRYFDFGTGPAPESLKDETDHYQKVAEYFLQHPELGDHLLVDTNSPQAHESAVGPRFSMQLCNVPSTMQKVNCDSVKDLSLSREYFKGDRSMRESGFDISFRFSAFGADTHHFAPACLNSLLYKAEKDLEAMSTLLGRPQEAEDWKKQAAARQKAIVDWMWDAQLGEFFDYNFISKKHSVYEYASTFYPLWAGLASKEQAEAVVKNLPHFERPGGFLTSPYETGAQWDAPYAWAPVQFMVVDGLRRYGYNQQADRLSYEFLSTVAENFRRDGTIREKYNAVNRTTESATTSGYTINVVGFGWTNAAFLEFLHQLPKEDVERLGAEQPATK